MIVNLHDESVPILALGVSSSRRVPHGRLDHWMGPLGGSFCRQVEEHDDIAVTSPAAANMQNRKLVHDGARRRRSNEEKPSGADWFSADELEAAREAYLEEQQQELPAPKVKYRYALALVKSKKRDDKLRGIALLEDLLAAEYEVKQCLYWVALTTYGLGDYRASRAYCEKLLRLEPGHANALVLHQRIKDVTANDQMMGIGLVSAVVVAGIALKLLLKR